MMKIIKGVFVVFLVMAMFGLSVVGYSALMKSNFWNKLDIPAVVKAAEVYEGYYEIQIKLSWDQLYNLDLYVTEPNGDIASSYNTTTSSGGEIGYSDSEGEWTYGDSGNNTAPEVYRVQYGLEGMYEINVFCNKYDADEEEEEESAIGLQVRTIDQIVRASQLYDVSANAFILATLYGQSEKETYLRFPESGMVEVASDVDDGWWNAGSFYFVPVAKKEYPWEIEDQSECFIATAAYGKSSELELLRSFRDEYLLTKKSGKLFVEIYKKVSPPIARLISKNSLLRVLVRAQLNPFIKLIKLM